jgi:hypothetical protein
VQLPDALVHGEPVLVAEEAIVFVPGRGSNKEAFPAGEALNLVFQGAPMGTVFSWRENNKIDGIRHSNLV